MTVFIVAMEKFFGYNKMSYKTVKVREQYNFKSFLRLKQLKKRILTSNNSENFDKLIKLTNSFLHMFDTEWFGWQFMCNVDIS